MSNFLTDLISVMKKESGCYRDLLNLSRDQKKILISGKLEGLQENVQQQEKIMFSLGPLSEVRQKSLEGLGKSLGFKKPTVAEVAGRLPEDQSASLRLAANELLDTVRDLDAVNSTNGQLLENAQAYAKFTLEAIQGTATIRPGDPGHVQVEKGHVASSFNQTA